MEEPSSATAPGRQLHHDNFSPILPFTTPSDLLALYELGAELGRGQFGVIRRCAIHRRSSRLQAGAVFACKSVSKLHPRSRQDVIQEATLLRRLSSSTLHGCIQPTHTGVVRLHDVVEDDAHVHLIMEMCRGGDLFERIVAKPYSEVQAAYLMKTLLETLQLCHSQGIMHRDIKPENILLVNTTESSPIKLADFGLAIEFSPGQKFSRVTGSPYYIAPEMLQGKYSQEIDVWSAGITLYIMLSGSPPFWAPTEHGLIRAIRKDPLEFPEDTWGQISDSARDLIGGMLCRDVKSRLTPAQALEHPWIRDHTKEERPAFMALTKHRYRPETMSDDLIRSAAYSLTSVEISAN